MLKQKQLIEAVAAQFSGAKKVQSAEEQLRAEVAELVLAGVIDLLRIISLQRSNLDKGRLPHKLKIAKESVQVAIVNQVPPGKVAAVARVLQASRKQLKVAQDIFDQFKSGASSAPYQSQATSCNAYPDAYEKCVRELWIAGTRASEKKSDDLTNPKDKSDKSDKSDKLPLS